MAINFLNTVDLNFNQLNKAAIQNLGADPVAGVLGQLYYNTAVSALKICTTAQVVGVSNAIYTEVGATSGVETISIGNASVNAGGVNTGLARTPGTGIGDVIITPAIYGGAANVGMVPTGGAADQYLDGTGTWVDVTTGDIESVTASTENNRKGIAVVDSGGPDPVVGLDIVGQTNLNTVAATDELLIYDVSATTNKAVTVSNLVGDFETTYTLPGAAGSLTDPKSGKITLTGSDGSTDIVNFVGTTGRVKISGAATAITVDLTDDVNIVDDLNVGGVIKQAGLSSTTGANNGALADTTALALAVANASVAVGMEVTGTGVPTNITIATVTDTTNFVLSSAITIDDATALTFTEINSFASALDMNNNRIQEVKTGLLGTDGVNLAQVELLVAGVGVFKGSYNANTNTPALTGASNIALDQGDYFVVSFAGTFLTEALEPGDFIFANNAIAAGSTPAIANYTIVQADANIAGKGATDGATQKGVAGFDSANFDVSSSGWVQLVSQKNPYGRKQALNNTAPSARVLAGGVTTFTLTLSDSSLFGTGAVSEDIAVEVTEIASPFQTVYAETTRSGSASMTIAFVGDIANDTYRALLTHV